MSSSNLAIEPDYIDVTAEVKASTVMTNQVNYFIDFLY